MVMTLRPAIVGLVMTATVAGCFDVHTTDYLVIDDFSDPNGNPANYHFQRWQCKPSNAVHKIEEEDCNIIAESNHESVLHLGATLYPYDGEDLTFTRAEVATYAMEGLALDVTSSAELRFSAKLAYRGSDSSPIQPTLVVALVCTNQASRASDGRLEPRVDKAIGCGLGSWCDYTPVLSDFSAKDSAALDACLAHVDAVKLRVETPTDDHGELVHLTDPVKFDLYVDDISLKPKQ